MSRDWTSVKEIDPYMDNPELDNIDLADESAMKLAFDHTFRKYPREVELCGVCGRPPHPCDDPECVPVTAPIAEKLRVTMRHNLRLAEALKKIVAAEKWNNNSEYMVQLAKAALEI